MSGYLQVYRALHLVTFFSRQYNDKTTSVRIRKMGTLQRYIQELQSKICLENIVLKKNYKNWNVTKHKQMYHDRGSIML